MTDQVQAPAETTSEEVAEGLLAVLSKSYPHLGGIDSIKIEGLSGDKIRVTTQALGKDPFTQELTVEDLVSALEEDSK